jgi:hypothetical protein
VHTPPYQPEGRGKIERFFRTSVVDHGSAIMWSTQLCGLAQIRPVLRCFRF